MSKKIHMQIQIQTTQKVNKKSQHTSKNRYTTNTIILNRKNTKTYKKVNKNKHKDKTH